MGLINSNSVTPNHAVVVVGTQAVGDALSDLLLVETILNLRQVRMRCDCVGSHLLFTVLHSPYESGVAWTGTCCTVIDQIDS